MELLKNANVTDVIDVRLNNTSQLAGFAKKDDLEYVLELVGIKYSHFPSLAPDEKLLNDFKKQNILWAEYEDKYYKILADRNVKDMIDEIIGTGTPAFLCSEANPENCHRRLLAEYIKKHSNENLKVIHLK